MKTKFLKKSLILASTLLLVGCNGKPSVDNNLLPYNDTLGETFDHSLLGKNNLGISIGDPGGLWVDKEDDPVYGGYCYVAVTDLNYSPNDKSYSKYAFRIYRSANLHDWEVVGALNGYGLGIIDEFDSWVDGLTWAPELIRDPKTGKYFMYFSARSYVGGGNKSYTNATGTYDRMYIGIAMSDSPCGPYEVISNESYYSLLGERNDNDTAIVDKDGNEITKIDDDGNILNLNGDVITKNDPPVNFNSKSAEKFISIPIKNNTNIFPVLDSSLFIDDDGEIYLYFVSSLCTYKEAYGAKYNYNEIFGIHMLDMMTPDYSSINILTTPNYLKTGVTKDSSGKILLNPTTYMRNESDYFNELNGSYSTVNEAPFMIKHNGKYYLTYAPCGTGNIYYSIAQAVSDKPLGTFTKLHQYNPVIGINDTNDYLCGTGHHSFVYIGDEIYALYHCFARGAAPTTSLRPLAVDKVNFTQVDDFEDDILVGNGPSIGFQPLPNKISGYTNIAKDATIKVINAETNTVKYLIDDIVPNQKWIFNKELKSTGDLTITLSWDKPQDVRALLVYNSASYYDAFKKIDLVSFKLSSKPNWTNENLSSVFIKDLLFNPNFADQNDLFMRQGNAAVATFDTLKVTEITLKISEKFIYQNEDGTDTNYKNISIGEICVLGKESE